MKAFLLSFLSGDESEVDSAIVCGVIALLVMSTLTAVALLLAPTSFTPGGYAGSAATIIGTVAAGKTARDRWAQGDK